jgi:hypothetical protein
MRGDQVIGGVTLIQCPYKNITVAVRHTIICLATTEEKLTCPLKCKYLK